MLTLCSILHGQNDYYFGYQEGFKYGCSCNDLPPKNVAYVQGNWDSGYLDGKIDGLKYVSSSTKQSTQSPQKTTTQQPPLYTPDYELIEKVLAEKQRVYNERVVDIQNRMNLIFQLVTQIRAKKGSLTQPQSNYISSYNTQVSLFSGWDFSVYQNYSNVVEYLNKIQAEIITWA